MFDLDELVKMMDSDGFVINEELQFHADRIATALGGVYCCEKHDPEHNNLLGMPLEGNIISNYVDSHRDELQDLLGPPWHIIYAVVKEIESYPNGCGKCEKGK